MTDRGLRQLDSVQRLSPPGPSMCQKVIPRLGEMTFPRVGVPREPAVVDTVGMDFLAVVEFGWEVAVAVWSEPVLGLLVVIPVGALLDR